MAGVVEWNDKKTVAVGAGLCRRRSVACRERDTHHGKQEEASHRYPCSGRTLSAMTQEEAPVPWHDRTATLPLTDTSASERSRAAA